jgi:ATP-dependent Clp protease ATP-binding subunit ClpC
MSVITSNRFPIVGTSYPHEFKEYIEPRSDFVGNFETIMVNEISEADAEKLLIYESFLLERQSKIAVSFGAIKRAVVLAKKYLHDKHLPSSAEELLKSAVVDAERRGEKVVTPDRVTAVAEEKVNIPMHEAEGNEAERLLHMEEIIHEKIVGQDEAVTAVAQALREYRSGLARKGGPIASFLFVGPTGVGKTELAKQLAEIQFGSEKLMVRFDMTEYQDKTSFFRFIGSPDGTVRGVLTDAVREKPYSLVLLDEFEKAYPDILNLFLQVLDDGRLTDNMSRVIDFTNTIVIATSNAHSDIINDALVKGESMAQIADYLRARLTDVLKPELLNRFSKIIVFRNLELDQLPQIVNINLSELTAALKEQGIMLSFSPEAVAKIAKLGYDPQYGARPLRRAIDEYIRAPLSEELLSKKIAKGAKIQCVVNDDKFDFVNN